VLRTISALALLAPVLFPAPASSHPLAFTQSELILQVDGTFQVEMVCDLDALALGVSQDADDAELVAMLHELTPEQLDQRVERLRELFRRRVRIRFDGQPVTFDVAFPDFGTARADEAEIPTVLGLTARLRGTVPTDAAEVEFFASRSFSDVHLAIVDESRQVSRRSVLARGARSDPFVLTGPVEPTSRGEVARRYLGLGFAHIMPDGLDHILFVVCLFLLSASLRPLVWQVTAFTLAHALTLTLASFDLLALSPTLVEPLIALSIAYVAIENVLTHRLTPWRPAVVFAFGLLHGLGFATVLRELGLPADERLVGLVTFNVGIELGQLMVIAIAICTVGWFRHRGWYRAWVVVPASAIIAVVGLAWTVQRVLQ
jgi:hydrogenase/urease accessory protein HupE